MSTFLFDSIVFGPVRSRRLGVSLGINLLPVNRKVCTFDCIYCECGWTSERCTDKTALPSRIEVYDALHNALAAMKEKGEKPDVITFAGNGEPTMHPDFEMIISDTVSLRDQFFPLTKISVLSNATNIHKENIRRALMNVEMRILKLDSAIPATAKLLNQHSDAYSVERTIELLKLFNGRFILQTLFIRGTYNGTVVNNTTAEELAAWLDVIIRLRPESVMVYTISRDTPLGNQLHKVPASELKEIAAMVEAAGIPVTVSG